MPRLKVTARSNSPFGGVDDAQHKFVIKVGTGLKGEKGEKGDRGLQGARGLQGIQGVKGDKGDRGDTGLINGATQVQVHSTTKVMYNGSSISANTAASREVGESYRNVMEVGAFGLGIFRTGTFRNAQDRTINHIFNGNPEELPPQWDAQENMGGWVVNRGSRPLAFVFGNREELFMSRHTGQAWRPLTKFYTSANTQLDSNGALKPSSPVLRVFSDHITGNGDGDAMAATYTKNGVGDYTISGTTGLRTDGWYVVIPNDMNGNPKLAIGTLDDKDGVITLKTYVRIFDMSTFKFVPDLERPLDIPDGRWIDLRFNDLPKEDDFQNL